MSNLAFSSVPNEVQEVTAETAPSSDEIRIAGKWRSASQIAPGGGGGGSMSARPVVERSQMFDPTYDQIGPDCRRLRAGI